MQKQDFPFALQEVTEMLSRHHRQLLDAQFNWYRALLQGRQPINRDMAPPVISENVERTIEASNHLLQAHVCAQNDLLQLSERWLSHWQRNLRYLTQETNPSGAEVLKPAFVFSETAVESLSKASRQINQFSCVRFGNAMLKASSCAQTMLQPKTPSHLRNH